MHDKQDETWDDWRRNGDDKGEGEEGGPPASFWTPSKFISRLGKEINHESSVFYWAHKNSITNIPTYPLRYFIKQTQIIPIPASFSFD